jgi:hypothetical protein
LSRFMVQIPFLFSLVSVEQVAEVWATATPLMSSHSASATSNANIGEIFSRVSI